MSIACEKQISSLLEKDDLSQMIIFINRCLNCSSEEEFNSFLLSFSSYLNFEFVLYAFSVASYKDEHDVYLVNLSNPAEWASEYDREGLLRYDPVRVEVERILATGARSAFIEWDRYTWSLSPQQQRVIERRKIFGLHHGFSFFVDSENKDFTFLFSFGSSRTMVSPKVNLFCRLFGPHLMATRKRLVVQGYIATLSTQENMVAELVLNGRTNPEIAEYLHITVNTVKYHLKNIFAKLHVTNRQQVAAVLLAKRYLSI